jgi:hypothetical protein
MSAFLFSVEQSLCNVPILHAKSSTNYLRLNNVRIDSESEGTRRTY